ncbi:MAG: prepilin-type N-terminal cleavage/methylation domain-containing protein [Gammaproteobacteria bacterium]|nr:prepilin-type N-terminal cleavage/methylation domain-containing protein [Gammaproteobacteria bacterium]
MLVKRSEKGLTLIELMIGMIVGLIVLSAVIYVFLLTIRTSADVRNGALLNKESTFLTDLIAGEIRRIGFTSASTAIPTAIFGIPNTSCLVYTYDKDTSTPGTTDDGYFAIWSAGGALYFSSAATVSACPTATTGQISSSLVSAGITSFSANSVSAANGSSVNTITFTLEVATKADDSWSIQLNKTVKIRNDEI